MREQENRTATKFASGLHLGVLKIYILTLLHTCAIANLKSRFQSWEHVEVSIEVIKLSLHILSLRQNVSENTSLWLLHEGLGLCTADIPLKVDFINVESCGFCQVHNTKHIIHMYVPYIEVTNTQPERQTHIATEASFQLPARYVACLRSFPTLLWSVAPTRSSVDTLQIGWGSVSQPRRHSLSQK